MAQITIIDGPNKLIKLVPGTTYAKVKEIYSEWKEWVQASDNAKYLQAFTTIGGEPVGGGTFAGDIYFLTNGWRILIEEDVITIDGVIFTEEEGENPFVVAPGIIMVQNKVSALVQTITPTINGLPIPTAGEIADAVWDETTATHTVAGTYGRKVGSELQRDVWAELLTNNNVVGSFGERVQALPLNIPSAVDNATAVWADPNAVTVISGAVPSAASIADAVWDEAYAAHSIAGTFGYLAQEMASDANNAHLVAMQAVSILEVLIKYEANRTKIDKTAFTLTVYDDDGVTPIRVFNLKNSLGAPSVTEVTERVPQ